MIKEFFIYVCEMLRNAFEESKRPTDYSGVSTEHLEKPKETLKTQPLLAAPVTNYPACHEFSDYLFRAMRDVPDICNLQSYHSANNIQAAQTGQYQYAAKLFKKDNQREIRKTDFIHEIQPWLNNSLETVRFHAEEDVKELQQQLHLKIQDLYQNYLLNCSKFPQRQQELWTQYQLQYQNELYHYNMQLQSILHLLCTVSVVGLTDYGFYVVAVFNCNAVPRISL